MGTQKMNYEKMWHDLRAAVVFLGRINRSISDGVIAMMDKIENENKTKGEELGSPKDSA